MSQRVKMSNEVLRVTVWSAFVIGCASLRLDSNRVSPLIKQEPAFHRGCEAFPNKRIVMVTPNLEYWDMFRNWFHHAKAYMGENDQLVVVAQDEGVVAKLRTSSFVFMDLNGTLTFPTRSGARESSQKVVGPFGSPSFNDLTGRRPAQILYFLKLNCTVLYSDVDTVWLGDVFQDVAEAGSHDLYITDDTPNNALMEQWNFCTCFLYLQPSPPVRELVQTWTNTVSDKTNDQYPFNMALKSDYATRQLVDFTVLPYSAFPPGYSTRRFWGTPGMHVLHANYKKGIEKKIKSMVKRHVWRP